MTPMKPSNSFSTFQNGIKEYWMSAVGMLENEKKQLKNEQTYQKILLSKSQDTLMKDDQTLTTTEKKSK